MNEAILKAVLISASLGALVGLERQWDEARDPNPTSDVPGLRTFALWGALGAVTAIIARDFATAFLPVCFAVFGLVTGFSRITAPQGVKTLGFTTFAVALLTFVNGILVVFGLSMTAVVIAVGMVLLLSAKHRVHAWSRSLTPEDVRAALQFAAISGVILPVVPDQGFGPLQAFNPFSIWFMVVLISGLGFAGYVAMRCLGSQAGIAVTGLVGGLASSTAATLAFSRKSREMPELSSSCSLANILACTVMLARVAVLVGVISPVLLAELWMPLLVMAVPGILYSLGYFLANRHGDDTMQAPRISNPLSLSIAIKFAVLYAIVVFLVKFMVTYRPGAGLLWVSFISGLTDMDAIALSIANTANTGTLDAVLCAKAVVIGAVSNTALKTAFALSLGSPGLRARTGGVLGATLLAGLAAFYFIGG